MRQWLDTDCGDILLTLEARELRQHCGFTPTEAEVERHAKPIRVSGREVRAAARYGDRAFLSVVNEQADWQAWGILCERALANPEPGFDANGSPVEAA